MAEKLLNPYSDAQKFPTGDLEHYYDRHSAAYLFRQGMSREEQDTLLHQLDLIKEELRRRHSLNENPDDSTKINEKSDKRTSQIQEGDEFRKKHHLDHSGFTEDHKPTLSGSAFDDHDPAVRAIRKIGDKVDSGINSTAEWLGKMADKWKK